MPVAGAKVLIELESKCGVMTSWQGYFAGYDTQTENYMLEDCFWTQRKEDVIDKAFFNRRFVVRIIAL